MGLPGPSSDVVINSGYSNYTVTLDTSPSVNSLIVGGNSAQLTDAGATRNVSIASTLTTNFSGSLNLQGPASTVSVDGAFYDNGFFSMYGTGELANFGQLYLSTTYSVVHISPGDTLNLTNQPGGIIDAPANSSVEIWGAFNNVVAGVSGLANLTSIEGSVQFRHGQTTTITPLGGTLSLNPDTNPDCSGEGGCLTVSDGSTIDITGNLRMNAGNLNIGSNMFGNGANTLNITGNLYNLGGHIFDGWVGDVLNVGGMVDNEVDFQLAAPSVVNIAGDLKNGGTFQSYNAIVSIAGNLNNRGGFFMNGFEGTVTATNISNSGEVIIGASETVRASGGGYTQSSGDTGVDGVLSSVTGVHINGGTLSGRGMVEGDIQMGGTLIPGYSSWVQSNRFGVLSVRGNYTQLAGGAFTEEIAGDPPSVLYGQLMVSGAVSLDGTLTVSLLNGYIPPLGSTYKFLLFTPGELTGTFATIPLDWRVIYDNANGYVELESVPEPSTFVMLGSGLLGALGAFRRKIKL